MVVISSYELQQRNMSQWNRPDDGVSLLLRYGLALCCMTFPVKCDIFTLAGKCTDQDVDFSFL